MYAGPKNPEDLQKPTLVLDLDETLVHSSFKPIPNPDYIIPVDIDGKVVDVYVLKVTRTVHRATFGLWNLIQAASPPRVAKGHMGRMGCAWSHPS